MRTTLDLDEKVVASVVKQTKAKSKSRAVEEALEDYLRRQACQRLLARAGTMPDFMKDFDYKAARSLDNQRLKRLFADPD